MKREVSYGDWDWDWDWDWGWDWGEGISWSDLREVGVRPRSGWKRSQRR
ncbi:hypothetical protein [Microtetraspora sp. NBRC 16547]|nr:hypothetical protein [Microtetraspora sp. NBRC 16547]GLX01464.1 hypothetical protein Misp02_55500 [Microtetraspora sp. NBRC 16547]